LHLILEYNAGKFEWIRREKLHESLEDEKEITSAEIMAFDELFIKRKR